jgi:TonB-like protein
VGSFEIGLHKAVCVHLQSRGVKPIMAKALRAGIVAAILIAVLAIATGVNGQTKDSPLLLYKGGGPVPKKIKTVIPKYPTSAQAGSMVLELTLRPDGKVDAVTAIRPLRGATEAAIAATKQWQYEPVFYRGKPAWAVIDILICNPWRCRPSVTRLSQTPTR